MKKQSWPVDIIPNATRFTALPPGTYLAAIESISDDDATKTEKYMLKVTLRVTEPVAQQHLPHFENFVIGTDQDSNADDPNSWTGTAAVRFKEMIEKAGVTTTGDLPADCMAAQGQVVGMVINNEVQSAQNRDGSPNAYAGRVSARVRDWFRPGERKTQVAPQAAPQAPALTGPNGPQQRAAAATAKGATATATVAQPKVQDTVKCSFCSKQVAKHLFQAHVQSHENEPEE